MDEHDEHGGGIQLVWCLAMAVDVNGGGGVLLAW
jgi:hypothetical protein